jgi:hypothetical protein
MCMHAALTTNVSPSTMRGTPWNVSAASAACAGKQQARDSVSSSAAPRCATLCTNCITSSEIIYQFAWTAAHPDHAYGFLPRDVPMS